MTGHKTCTLLTLQNRLEPALKKNEEWEGLTGQAPTPGRLAQVLGTKDAFIYSGHGSGSQYLSSDEIEKLKVRLVPLLFGCSSAQLNRYGRNVDPIGIVQSYLVGSSPALVGFLWPVTDMDVDHWTLEFLDYWLTGQEGELLQAVADKRASFNHFTNSCALVVYGLPIGVKL